MPTYGRSFTLVNNTQFDIGAAASGGGLAGKFTNEAGFMSYYEICSFLSQPNTTLVWDSEQQVPFAYRNDQWIGFDDERSLKTKVGALHSPRNKIPSLERCLTNDLFVLLFLLFVQSTRRNSDGMA